MLFEMLLTHQALKPGADTSLQRSCDFHETSGVASGLCSAEKCVLLTRRMLCITFDAHFMRMARRTLQYMCNGDQSVA
jgi:hypothetical protein